MCYKCQIQSEPCLTMSYIRGPGLLVHRLIVYLLLLYHVYSPGYCRRFTHVLDYSGLNPFKSEFTIVIFIHYKLRIAVAILDSQWIKMT